MPLALLICEESGLGGIQTTISLLQHHLQHENWDSSRISIRENRPPMRQLIYKATQADVLIASNNFMPAYWTVLLGKLVRRPSVVWVHGPISEVLGKATASKLKQAWLRWIYKRADLLVCASETSRSSLLHFMGNVALNTHVIHNPCIPPQANNSEPVAVQASETPFNSAIRLGFVGRLSSEKQPLKLLEMIRCLPPPYQLDVIGDGPLMPDMRQQGSDLITSGRLRLLGSLQATATHYRSWQATLLCSAYEGYPMTALESLACATPCIATPISALKEMLGQHAPYMLAKDHSPAALAQAVQTVLSLPQTTVQTDVLNIINQHTPRQFGSHWAKSLSTVSRTGI